jgi:hypothetical protein
VVVQAVLLLSTAWCIPHLGVSCADHKSSRFGAITHSINRGSSSHNSNSSTVLLLHHRSNLPSGHHSSLPPATFHASTMERWGTLFVKAASPSKIAHHELRHPWSTSREARGVMHHGLGAPTTPQMRFPLAKMC